MSTFDDAQRFLDMRAAGWTDPGVNMPRRTQRKKKIVDPAAAAGESTPEETK